MIAPDKGESALRRSSSYRLVPPIVLFGALAAVMGAAAPTHERTALGVAFAVVVLTCLRNASPQVWTGVAIAAPWTERLLTGAHLAPRVFDFVDFPLAALALGTSLLAWSRDRPRLPRLHKRIVAWLAVTAGVIACSWLVNDAGQPQRLLAAYLIELEPFMILAAVLLSPPNHRQLRALLRLVLVIAGAQVAAGVIERFTIGRHDPDYIVGTLLHSSTGQAPESAAILLAAFLVTVFYRRLSWTIGSAAAALAMLEVTDSKQVLYVIPIGLVAFAVFPKIGRLGRPAFAAGSLVLMLAIIIPAALLYPGTKAALGYINLGGHDKFGKPPVVAAMEHNFKTQPTSIPFGFGPGETVSRFAFLTTPLLLKGGSPISILGIPAGKYTATYQTLATENIPPSVGISSFDQAQSSLLGIVGDYGLAGAIAFAGLIFSILRALWARGRSSPFAAAAFAGWLMILPLAYIFDWLEEPAYTTYLAAVTGLALTWVGLRRRAATDNPLPLLIDERDARHDGRPAARQS